MYYHSVSFENYENDEEEGRSVDLDDKTPTYRREITKNIQGLLKSSPKPKKKEYIVNDHVSKRILLLQDILYELPELETNVMNSLGGVNQRHKRGLSAKFFRLISGLIFIGLIYSCIFVMGLIVSSYLLSPIPITGTIMRSYVDSSVENDLQKIVIVPPTEGTNILKIRGSFKVAYNIYNNTPFSGSLSVFMNVSYLPLSGAKSTNEKCFGDSSYKFLYKYIYNNVKTGKLGFFNSSQYENYSSKDDDVLKKKRFGSLLTLEKVQNEKDMDEQRLDVLETTVYNAFLRRKLAGNKIEIIPKIRRGFNKIVILSTLEMEIDPKNEPYITKRIVYDCSKNGFLTLKFDSTYQSFDTMLFSGNLLPTSFMPVTVPCIVSSDGAILDKISSIARNQRVLYNRQQYVLKKLNTSLNM